MADQLEYPDQSYYPSAKVTLAIRFDEFGDTAPVTNLAPKKILTRLSGTKDSRGNLKIAPVTSPTGATVYQLTPPGSDVGGPQTQDASQDNLTHTIAGIIPKKMEIQLNGVRTADTLKIEFLYKDMPVDPRTVRACAVSAYLGTVSADDFIRGNSGQTRLTKGGDTETRNVVPDDYVDATGAPRTNLRFQGFVDEWELHFPEDDEPTVSMTCRDNTALMIDTDAPPRLVIAVGQPIDQAVATYLSNFPSFAGMTVEYRPGGGAVPTLKQAPSHQAGGRAPGLGAGTGGKLSTWDYLTDAVRSLGHSVRVEGTNIIIEQVATMTDDDRPQRDDDPFQSRNIAGQQVATRQFIYGKNLLEMGATRKFGGTAPQNVEVRCYSSKRKKTLVSRYPPEHSPIVTRALPGDGSSEVAYHVVNVSGVEDEAALATLAQSTYESRGRNEITTTFRTKNLASFGGGNLDPDVLDMRAGDAFELLVNRADIYSTVTHLQNILSLREKMKQFVIVLGFSEAFATAYATAYSNLNFLTKFFCKSIAFSWAIDEGVTIELTGITYIGARLKQELPPGQQQAPGGSGTKQKQPTS